MSAVAGDVATVAWQERIGYIETALSFFGTTFVVEVERADGVEVYVQGRRVGDSLEIEAVGNRFLSTWARLTDEQIGRMTDLGWEAPLERGAPNFAMTVYHPSEPVIHELAVVLARTLADVYGVRPEDEWRVSPTEFGTATSGINEEGIFEIFEEGPVVNWAWKGASQYAAIPRLLHEVIFETMRVGGKSVRSGPFRDGTVGAFGMPTVVGAELVTAAGVVFARTTDEALHLRLSREEARRVAEGYGATFGVSVVDGGEVFGTLSGSDVEVVLPRPLAGGDATGAWKPAALRLGLKAMASASDRGGVA